MLCDLRSFAPLHFFEHAGAAQRAASVGGLLLHALVRFLRPKDRLTVDESDAHAVADRVRLLPRECEDVDQKGFDALVRRLPPTSRP